MTNKEKIEKIEELITEEILERISNNDKKNKIGDQETTVIKTSKEQFDELLGKINKMSEAIELHEKVKTAVQKNEVDYNYLRYTENILEEKLFPDINIKGIMPKVLLENICPDLAKIEKFDSSKLEIENVGRHFEEQESYLDKICVYDGKLISVFGINDMHPDRVIKYEPRKFTRADMIEAVQGKYEEGKKVSLYQYDEYYIGIEEDRIQVFTERKITSLVKVEETIFDKIKAKLTSLFAKKKCYPDIQQVYDSNPNRLKNIENKSKVDAKSRMKILLNKEREITRSETANDNNY